jgi:hypothetical protein
VRSPEGGEKDSIAPVVDSTFIIPQLGAVNVSSGRVELLFDEYVKLSKPSEQIIISPVPSKTPEYVVKGKKLIFNVADTLQKNTTYNISFGNAIQDITEGNAVVNFNLVFSTGDFLDSLQISGLVYDALTLKPKPDVGVLLYRDTAFTHPLKVKPGYFVRTSANGQYRFNHLAAGIYRVVAVDDKNGNLYFDSPEESIGFLSEVIQLNKDTVLQDMYISKPEESGKPGNFKISKTGVFSVAALDTLHTRYQIEGGAFSGYVRFQGRDSLYRFARHPLPDSIIIKADRQCVDSLMSVSKTIKFHGKAAKKPVSFKLISSLNGGYIEDNQPLVLESNGVFDSLFPHLISVYCDTVPLSFQALLNNDSSVVSIQFKRTPKTKYSVVLQKGALVNYLGIQSDSVTFRMESRKEDYYGELKIEATAVVPSNYILELLDSKGLLISRSFFNQTATIKQPALHPGDYFLKIIIDDDDDKRWTPGDYLNLKQPERILYYTEPVQIRSNWQMDVKWNINTR